MIALRSILIALVSCAGCRCGGDGENDDHNAQPGAGAPCPDSIAIELAYPGASPAEVELGVVLAVEEAARAVDGVDRVEAIATEGHAEVTLWLGRGSDVGAALRDTREALDRLGSLPDEVDLPVIGFRPGERRASLIVLRAPPGVHGSVRERVVMESRGEAAVRGARPRELVVEVDPDRARAYGLGADDIARAVGETVSGVPAGGVVTGPNRDVIVRTQQVTTAMELDQTFIAVRPDATPVRLADVAEIRDGYAELPFAFDREGPVLVVLAVIPEGADRPPLDDVLSDARYVSPPLRVRRCGDGSRAGAIDGPVVVASLRPPAGTEVEELVGIARAALARAGTGAVAIGGDAPLAAGPRAPADPALELVVPATAPAATAARLRAELAAVPGVEVAIVSPAPGAVVALEHEDLDLLERGARRLAAALRDRGAADVAVGAGTVPRRDIRLHPDGLQLGLTATDLARQLRAATRGVEVAELRDGGDALPVIVRLPERDAADLDDLLVDVPGGSAVPLRSVAEVTESVARAAIHRRDGRRVVYVTASPGDAGSDAIDEALGAVRDELGEVTARRLR